MNPSLKKQVYEYYQSAFTELLGKDSKKNPQDAERSAQLTAISKTFQHFFQISPEECTKIWDALRAAHLKRKANIDFELNEEQIDSVISAAQSWVKSSGHAAEAFFADFSKNLLSTSNIEIVLQKNLSSLIKEDKITNPSRDLAQISSWIDSGAFDLYFIFRNSEGNGFTVFGCVQSKTSIRDRVTRDREPSIHAMSNYFWSVALTVDGTFLGLGKFKAMVNGGDESFPENGWHGLYALSTPVVEDRIYHLDSGFNPLVEHAKIAKAQFIENRQWFNRDWRASN